MTTGPGRPRPPQHRRPAASNRPQPTPARSGAAAAHAAKAAKPDKGEWIYGRHAGLAALANRRRRVLRIVVVDELAPTIAAAAHDRPLPPPEIADRQRISRLLPDGAVHQGLAVRVEPLSPVMLEDVLATTGDDAVFVVLDQATDPRNVGAGLRAAAAFRAAAVVVQDRHAPAATGAVAKAASGALERLPLIFVVNIARTLRTLRAAGVRVIGFAAAAEHDLANVPLAGRVALVFGAEDHGLRRLVRESCDALARIPIDAATESLNLGTAAAIALYEAARRRPTESRG